MALPTSNILNLPFRRTQPTSLSTALHAYISSSYNQHPSLFTADLSTIDTLRRDATTITDAHPSNIRKLHTYTAQLVWLTSKFPLDVGADFVWYPSLGYHADVAASANNLRFELANVLFNLGVLYCQLGVYANRTTQDGLKTACNYFCAAAGTFRHLKDVVVPEMRAVVPEDMDTATLECVEGVMLAQAQECFWATAVKGSYRDSLIAKVASRVAEMYQVAEEAGRRSDAVSSEWIHHLKAKQGHFGGVAQLRAARAALEKREYGEEVARLREGLVCANEGLREARYINKTVLADLQGLKVKLEDDYKRAENDNDIIYLKIVPSKMDLPLIEGATMVSAKTPKEVLEPVPLLHEGRELGKPLFVKLVSYQVHLAASVYASRRDETVQKIVSELEGLTSEIHATLQSLNLPGSLQALEKPLGLPPGLVSHAEEIRQQRGIARLQAAMDDITKLKQNDRRIYDEGVSALRSEAEDDENARKKYGTDRWSRPPSNDVAQHLYNKMTEIESYFTAAEATDANVLSTVHKNESVIRLLASSDRALEDAVPSARRTTIPPAIEAPASKLRTILNDLTRLESRRHRKIEALKTKGQDDDVNPDLFKEAARLERENPSQTIEAALFEPLFDLRLERYDTDYALITSERDEQSALMKTLNSANTAFNTARRGDTSSKDREQALQTLENAYFAYKEIVQNLDVGRRFYNDLAGIVTKFRDEAGVWAKERRREAGVLEGEIVNALPVGGLSVGGREQQQQHRQAPPNQQQQQPRTRTAQQQTNGNAATSAAPVPVVAAPAPAPVPQNRTWTEDMPINFAPRPSKQQAATVARGGGGQPQAQAQAKDGRWDSSKGVKFG